MAGNAVASIDENRDDRPRTPVEQVQKALSGEKMTAQLKMALPSHIPVEKFKQVALTAVNKSPDLAVADHASLFNACVECAQDGLLPNGREAALVIYNTKVKDAQGNENWVQMVRYMPMIAGIYKKVRESGEINRLAAHVVFEGDDFEYSLGINPTLTHRPNLESTSDKVIGAYAVAHFADGEHDIEFMSMKQINKVKAASKSPSKGPWANWFEEMAKKTVVRRLSKRLPMSPSLDAIIRRQDDMIDLDALSAPDKPQVTASALIEQARGPSSEGEGITVAQEPADLTDEEREPFTQDEEGPRQEAEQEQEDAEDGDPMVTLAEGIAAKGTKALDAWLKEHGEGIDPDWMKQHEKALRVKAAAAADGKAEQTGLGI